MSLKQEKEIFLAAISIESPAERAAFLDQACAGNPALRQRVAALFEAQSENQSFLEHPALDAVATELVAGREVDPCFTSRDTFPEMETRTLAFLSPSDYPDALGRLGQYEILEVIGRGGMGIVLKARDPSLDRVVAIKVLSPELASNVNARKRFLREAKTAAAVTHQHVVTIHSVGEDRLPYLVMECINGQSLQDKLDQQGPLELREVLRIGTQVASGLAAAHAHGVIHRDIKPANILLENGIERVRITDFGLARAVDDVGVTRTGEVAGTPQYMSPEQAQGQPVDARSDLFSFGSVLYTMCTGRPPFRAESTIDAIRRVCDDTPRPIREINAEIPEWLTAIIDRLLAKRPEERFQSVQEVAQLLTQHLAHVQDPGSTPFPMFTPPSPLGGEDPGVRGTAPRHWIAAAIVLCAVLAGLGVTEATGVTRLTGTVVRIVTGEGTLIIETDDPNVRISLDGEELTISGGGVEQVRLRPGQYQFVATRNGQPVKQELVTITRGGERVVTVSREAIAPTITIPETAVKKGAFVLLGGASVAERRFDTLTEAVKSASDGDTIEIRGNGPFVSQPIVVTGNALAIRAGKGFRPIIQLSLESLEDESPLLLTDSRLVLEGLEFQRVSQKRKDGGLPHAIQLVKGAPLHAANCRFRMKDQLVYCNSYGSTFEFRNCEFLGAERQAVDYFLPDDGRLIVSNCLYVGVLGVCLQYERCDPEQIDIQLTRNTIIAEFPFYFSIARPPEHLQKDRSTTIHVQAEGNVFDGSRGMFHVDQTRWFVERAQPLDAAGVEALMTNLFDWNGERNLYPKGVNLVLSRNNAGKLQPTRDFTSLATWKDYWGTAEQESLQDRVRFQGGDLRSKVALTPELVTPDDFRLRPDSPGYHSGPDGKDLGADVDLVGPGAAYERWKKTPEYQQWLEDTRQVRPEVPKPEPKAFIVMGSKDVAEREFDTLASAVLAASNGDTIEVRSNGPFDTPPITIRHPLFIRAGNGFQPVIRLRSGETGHVLHSSAPLVLEGLEIRYRLEELKGELLERDLLQRDGVIRCEGASLDIANCRLIGDGKRSILQSWPSPSARIVNSELLNSAWDAISCGNAQGRLEIHNCIAAAPGTGDLIGCGTNEFSMSISRSTSLTGYGPLGIRRKSALTPSNEPENSRTPPISIELVANVLDAPVPVVIVTPVDAFITETIDLSREQRNLLAPQLFAWREDYNLYRHGNDFCVWVVKKTGGGESRSGAARDEWTALFQLGNTHSRYGKPRYRGGDLRARLAADPLSLSPDDFRLQPDSPGYRADPDGKDLGAEVDLVGPGAAYERWKKTPEYQQWLEDTGQIGAAGGSPGEKADGSRATDN